MPELKIAHIQNQYGSSTLLLQEKTPEAMFNSFNKTKTTGMLPSIHHKVLYASIKQMLIEKDDSKFELSWNLYDRQVLPYGFKLKQFPTNGSHGQQFQYEDFEAVECTAKSAIIEEIFNMDIECLVPQAIIMQDGFAAICDTDGCFIGPHIGDKMISFIRTSRDDLVAVINFADQAVVDAFLGHAAKTHSEIGEKTVCFECGEAKSGMKCCSKCRRAYYCSAECQVSNWATHKADCKIMRKWF